MEPKSKLLLVEDSDDDAFFFERALQKSGIDCTLHRAANGAEAMDFLLSFSASAERPGIVFLDLKMPVLNGFEVLEWLQKQSFRHQLQVVVLSGSEQESDRIRAAELGAADYVVKPITVSDLNRFLHDICPAKVGARS